MLYQVASKNNNNKKKKKRENKKTNETTYKQTLKGFLNTNIHLNKLKIFKVFKF